MYAASILSKSRRKSSFSTAPTTDAFLFRFFRLGFAITQCLPFSDSRPDAPVLSL